MEPIELTQQDKTHLDYVIEWALLVMTKEEVEQKLQSHEGLMALIGEFNNSFQAFCQKVLDMNPKALKALSHAFMIRVYYRIRRRDLITDENSALTEWEQEISNY